MTLIQYIVYILLPFCSRRRLCSSWRRLRSASPLYFVTWMEFIDTKHLHHSPPPRPPRQQWGFVMFFGAALAEGPVCRTAAGKAAAGLGGGKKTALQFLVPLRDIFEGSGSGRGTLLIKCFQELPKTRQQRWDCCDFPLFGTETGSAGWTQRLSTPGQGHLHPPASPKCLTPPILLPQAWS